MNEITSAHSEDNGDTTLPVLRRTDTTDTALDVAAFVTSAVPAIGGPLSNLLGGYASRRKLGRIYDMLEVLSREIGTLSAASNRFAQTDEFEEILEHTLKSVSNARHKEKRIQYARFLRSTLVHAPSSYDETIRFLEDLDRLQLDHLEVLKAILIKPRITVFITPPRWTPLEVLQRRGLQLTPDQIKERMDDLYDIRIIRIRSSDLTMSGRLMGAQSLHEQLTPYETRFLKYLSVDGQLLRPEALYEPSWIEGHDDIGKYADLNFKGVVQRMRWIKPGRFIAGSPMDEEGRPSERRCELQREVVIERGFWMADTTCTQAMWEAVMPDDANPSWERHRGPELPVNRVAWYPHIIAFIERLNCPKHVRMPTSDEWEYACRAGSTTAFWFGSSIPDGMVNYSPEGDYHGGGPIDVKSLPPNPWGLYQMHGNVWENCCTEGWAGGSIKGGCWKSPLAKVRSAANYGINANGTGGHFGTCGFRLLAEE